MFTMDSLQPIFLLDEEWKEMKYIGTKGKYFTRRDISDEEKKMLDWIRATRIEIADMAETKLVSQQADFDYIKTELGMNIVLPKGNIEELRFFVTLKGDGEVSNNVYAIDGFPDTVIEEHHIIQGKITIGVTELMKFIPILSDKIPLKLELGPWKFQFGYIRFAEINFSGPKTATPEWYFRAKAIKNELRITLTIAKAKTIQSVEADVKCGWIYDPGIFSKVRLGSDEKTIQIYK